jgi:hypothetical protein
MNQNKWLIPNFYLRNKQVAFPKIKQAADFVKTELDKRELVLNTAKTVVRIKNLNSSQDSKPPIPEGNRYNIKMMTK